MIEAALMVSLTCIFAIVGTYIPVLTFILLLIPIPFIILGKRHGIKYVVLSVFSSAVITGSLTEPIYAIFVITLPGITAIVMGYMMNKEYSPGKVLAAGAVAALISSIISIQLGAMISGVQTLSQVGQMFKETMDMSVQLYKSMGMEGEQLEQIQANLEATRQLAMVLIPSAILFSSTFLSYINYVLTISVLKRLGYKVEGLPPLTHFRLPKSILMGTFLIIGLTMAIKYLEIVNYQTLVLNVFVIFQLIYLIQGLAVVSYFMIALRLGRFPRILIFLFLFFNQTGLFLLAMIGFTDSFVNFRKLQTNS